MPLFWLQPPPTPAAGAMFTVMGTSNIDGKTYWWVRLEGSLLSFCVQVDTSSLPLQHGPNARAILQDLIDLNQLDSNGPLPRT